MEFYIPAEIAEDIIAISKKYGVDAKIIGRVEASEDGKAQVHLTSEHGTFIYNK
jgi:phosphoribosylformylglycinamidine cyclo-ligase